MQQWTLLYKNFRNIYKIYGGLNAFIKSPYVHISFALSLIVFIYDFFGDCTQEWYAMPISVLPSTVGFSVTAYALSLTFGNQKFHDTIRGVDENEAKTERNSKSPYIKISSSFAHFVLTQFLALIFAVFSKSLTLKWNLVAFLGTFLFYYALLLGMVTTLNLFFLSDMYDRMPKGDSED